jgi:hypothetical protein
MNLFFFFFALLFALETLNCDLPSSNNKYNVYKDILFLLHGVVSLLKDKEGLFFFLFFIGVFIF